MPMKSADYGEKFDFQSKLVLYLLLTFFLIASYSRLYAEGNDINLENLSTQTKQLCQSVAHLNITNTPDETTKISLKGCDSLSLYYGFNSVPDYFKAFQCAFINKDYPVLVMAYANGKGVPFNPDMAMHFACMMDGAPAEMDARIAHLAEIKKQNRRASFDICDDITSGYMMGWCSSIDQHLKDTGRDKKIKQLIGTWPLDTQERYQQLKKAASVYIRTHSTEEIDLSGTARNAIAIGEQLSLNERLLELLQKMDKCSLPSVTSSEYKQAEKQLNLLYQKVLAAAPFPNTTLTKEGIEKTEASWIKYRDAWVQLAKLKCPQLSNESLRTLLIRDRIHQLNKILEFSE